MVDVLTEMNELATPCIWIEGIMCCAQQSSRDRARVISKICRTYACSREVNNDGSWMFPSRSPHRRHCGSVNGGSNRPCFDIIRVRDVNEGEFASRTARRAFSGHADINGNTQQYQEYLVIQNVLMNDQGAIREVISLADLKVSVCVYIRTSFLELAS
jgi:hypothetical protein